jgi:hypothetical protein
VAKNNKTNITPDDDSLVDINIYEYGDDRANIKISVVKVWDIDEQVLIHMHAPIFNIYLNWIKENQTNESFIQCLHIIKLHNDSLILKQIVFKIDIASGTIVDLKNKVVAEIDGMLAFNNIVLYIKGMELWISNREDPKEQYYCKRRQ